MSRLFNPDEEKFQPLNQQEIQELRNKMIGLGERSFKKSYYPDLQQRLLELENEKENTSKANDLLRDFLAIAAHEFRTPITTIVLLVDLLRRGQRLDQTRIADYSEKLWCQVTRLARMVNELLDISRLEKGLVELKIEEVNGSGLVQKLVEDFCIRHPERKISIIRTIQQKGTISFQSHIKLDASRFQQVIENLLENSWKYSTPDTPINIVISEKKTFFRVAVLDSSKGIGKSKRKQIFNLYNRAADPSNVGGLGLGLPISRQIIELHGGALRCWSREGKGSVFIVRIPHPRNPNPV